jgi:hypothetical protein
MEKLVQDYILLIMNCEKYRDKAQKQKETWIPLLPTSLKYYHVIGNPDLETEFLFLENEHILYVKIKDDYNSLPKKVISSYNAVHKSFQYKYIFKTDDDQNLLNPKFFNMMMGIIPKKEPKVHYGGLIVDVKTPYLSQYHRIHPELPKELPVLAIKYCNGRFYFLSREAVAFLLLKKEQIGKEYLEYYAIGLNLNEFLKSNMLYIQSELYFKDF